MDAINILHRTKFTIIAVIMYLSGIVIHGLRFVLNEQPSEFVPVWFDQIILVLSLYVGSITMWFLLKLDYEFSISWLKPFLWFKVFFLITTQVIHLSILMTGNNEILNVFPPGYSIFVLFFFSFSGYIYYNIERFLNITSDKDEKIGSI